MESSFVWKNEMTNETLAQIDMRLTAIEARLDKFDVYLERLVDDATIIANSLCKSYEHIVALEDNLKKLAMHTSKHTNIMIPDTKSRLQYILEEINDK